MKLIIKDKIECLKKMWTVLWEKFFFKYRVGFCIYCWERPGITRDHVPQKSLFLPGTDRLTVPACLECNRGLSKDEEYFKVFATMAASENSEPALKVFEDGTVRTLARNRKLAQEMNQKMTLVEVADSSDKGHEIKTKYEIDDNDWLRITRIVESVFRGVYFLETGKALHPRVKVDIQTLPVDGVQRLVGVINKMSASQKTEMDVFWYRFGMLKNRPLDAIALLVFYDNLSFSAIVMNNERRAMKRKIDRNKTKKDLTLIIRPGGPGWEKT